MLPVLFSFSRASKFLLKFFFPALVQLCYGYLSSWDVCRLFMRQAERLDTHMQTHSSNEGPQYAVILGAADPNSKTVVSLSAAAEVED